LKGRIVIRKLIAALLLLIFAIGSSPKIFFHDLLAKHKDTIGCTKNHHSTAVHKQGINCHFDDLVVTAPFVPTPSVVDCALTLSFQKPEDHFTIDFYSQHHFFSELRGPPSQA